MRLPSSVLWKGDKTFNLSNPSDFFECKMCGDCCKGFGGTYVTEKDIDAISGFLNTDPNAFRRDYCQLSGTRPVLRTGPSGYCIFWDQICTIHEVKPRMCKLWPFIEAILVDPTNWISMHSMCPGIHTDVDEKELAECVREQLRKHSR